MTTPSHSEERNDPSAPGNGGNSYLWDRTGPVDPVIEKLENILAGSGLQRVDAIENEPAQGGALGGARLFRSSRVLSLAALIALALGAAIWYAVREPVSKDGWYVDWVGGAPRANGRALEAGRVLGLGKWLETDASSSATVRVPKIGRVDVSPNSRLCIEQSSDARHQVNLDHGRIAATISAPERIFFVKTRAALATDMGCQYDLTMPKAGPGLLTVTLGWVLLEGNTRTGKPWEARVPRGVSCVIYEDIGPGTPFAEGATAMRDLLTPYDTNGWEAITQQQLNVILDGCGTVDVVTLWHLLYRVEEPLRAAVFSRLSSLIALPPDIKAQDAVKLREEAMERMWPRVRFSN